MLFINEWRYCLRQPLVWFSLILMPTIALLLTGGIGGDSSSPEIQLQFTQVALLMLIFPIILGALSPLVFLRDTSANMTELINCTPVSHRTRWLLRYGMAVSLFLLLFVLSFTVVLISFGLQFGFSANLFILTMLNLTLLVLPSILIGTAFVFCLSITGRSVMVIYASTAAFGMIYLLLASLTGSPMLAGSSVISESFYNTMLWLDPYGITGLIDNINSTNAYVNSQLLLNRLVYLLSALSLVYVFLNKKTQTKVNNKTKVKADLSQRNNLVEGTSSQQVNAEKKAIKRLQTSAFIQLIKVPFFTLLHNRVTQVIFVVWPLVIFNEVLSGINYVEVLSVISPNSMDALNRVAFDLVPAIGAFIVALWSWYICSRDKSYNIAELIAATPISNIKLVLAQVITLGLLIFLLLLLTFVGSSLAELVAGSEWLFNHYVVQLSLVGLPLLLLGTLFISLHHICRSTLTSGVIVIIMLLVKFTPIMTGLGMTHTLWNFADSPLQAPDSFWGFSGSASVYLPYMTVWLLACVSSVLFAASRSHRGTGLDKISMKGLPKKVPLSFAVTLLAALSLHFALVNEKPLTNSDKRESWKAQYETAFAQWQDKLQPSIVHIDSEIDIYPEQQKAHFKLSYTLENQTAVPLKQVLIGRYGNYAFGDIALDGAELVEFNSELNQGIYQFSTLLMPGEQRILKAKFSFHQPQFWPHRSQQVVKPAFTYLNSTLLIPTVGYQVGYRLENPQVRAKYGLKEIQNLPPSIRFKGESSSTGRYQWASLSTTISTKKGHSAISQGDLVSRWELDQRAYFKFETKQPVRTIPTWLSVPLVAQSQNSQGVRLNVYSPHYNQATSINLKAMDDTLTWFAKHITPYAGTQLNLITAPDIGDSGYTLPQIMLINDTIGFRAMPSKNAGFDQRYRRAVNQTAHQWFGHGLGNGVVEDRSFLSESMVKYIELVTIEDNYGREAMLALVELEQNRFDLSERINFQKAVALIDATQAHNVQSRATIVFAQLRETIGDGAITAAIKSLWLQHAYPKTPATSMDFVRALKRHTEVKYHQLINELFLSNTTRDE